MNSTIARQDNGSIQITFTIPWAKIEKKRKDVALQMGESVTVPGFRKGKAPLAKLLPKLNTGELIQKTLGGFLPDLFQKSLAEHKLKPALFPRFEVVSADDDKPWQVRAITCELPQFELGSYKKAIKGELKTLKKPSPENKEQKAIDTLLKSVNLKVPQILVDEEVNARLSGLLERIEKLGLTLDKYLQSVGKDVQKLRQEYATQAESTLKLELLLGKIAEEEKIAVSEPDVNKFIDASKADPNFQKPNDKQKDSIKAFLRKRKTIDFLTTLG